MSGTKRLAAGAAIAAAVATGGPAAVAQAGTYTVEACQSARSWGYGSFSFELQRTTRLLGIRRACAQYGRFREEGGLAAVAGGSRGRVAQGAHARALFRAPPGMTIARVEWTGLLKRCDSAWTAGVAASNGGAGRWVMLPGRNRFTDRCEARVRRSAPPPPTSLPGVAGATSFYTQVRCTSPRGCAVTSLRAGEVRADARTLGARVTLVDPAPPEVRLLGGELMSKRWLNGRRELRFSARDASGISLENVVGAKGPLGSNPRSCNPTQKIPCPATAVGRLNADTGRAPDGPQTLTLRVHDATGQARSIGFPAYIDNTPPAPVTAAVAGGEGWRRSGPLTVTWQNPPEPGRAPIAGAFYQLRRAGTAEWSPARLRSGTGIARMDVPVEPGEWELRMWRGDQAGNSTQAHASAPVRLRYDPEVPALSFAAQDASDPARVSVIAREQVSGLAGGEIEARREGEAAWRPVPTGLAGPGLVARLDDAALPAGVYALRARASDRAGNVGFGERRADGFPAVISLPARARSAMRAGVRRRAGRRGRKGRRRGVRLAPVVRARQGRRVVVRGKLTGPAGAPLANTALAVTEQPELAPARPLGAVRTGPNGGFRVVLRAARNAVVRIVYPGSARMLPSERLVRIRVPAASTIRASRRRVRNGRGVTFAGRVRTLPVPATGKLVEIQAHFRGRWRTFQTVRTSASGRWRFRYRFGATTGRVRFRFRVLLSAEGEYPYSGGVSRTVRVTVTG